MLAGGAGLPDLEKTEAVVLANVDDLGASDAQRLGEFVERGGGLLVFTGDRVAAGAARDLEAAGLGVGEGPRARERRRSCPGGSSDGSRSTRSSSHSPTPSTATCAARSFTRSRGSSPDPDARVLAWFRGGEPALLERTKGRGKVLWFTSACDRAWGDWPRGRMYLPMVHQMLAYVSGLAEGGPDPSRDSPATSGNRASSSPTASSTSSTPTRSNRRRRAARRRSSPTGSASSLPGPESPSTAAAAGPGERTPTTRLRSDEIWPWLALTLVGLLLVENFLANRTAA